MLTNRRAFVPKPTQVAIGWLLICTWAAATWGQEVGPAKGSLILAGGSVRDPAIYQEFLDLAGGPDAPIIVIPTAGSNDDYGPFWPGLLPWKRLGATNLTVLHTRDPQQADSEDFTRPLLTARGVWFSGGRQWRLADSYLGTRTEQAIHHVLERGGVIGGSSAGATIQGSYLARGDSRTNTVMMGDHEVGLGLLKNVAVDQHLLARNRQFDLLEIIEAKPELLGIGLDEDTAIVVHGDRFEVIGQSYVAIYDTETKLDNGGSFYFLAPGDHFDLATRRASRPSTEEAALGRVVHVDRAAVTTHAFDPPTRAETDSKTSPPFDVVEATIAEIQQAVASGRVTCRTVVQSYLERIAALDDNRGLNAITEINPRALERADEIDRAWSLGEPLGPLFCSPILVKDNFDTHDLATTGGSIALQGSLPPDDAFMVRRLRQAGAIVIAKTNMAEWAFSPRQTISSSYGTTANAYALDRVPAGSSGGTASAVAASFGVAGLGSDTGNSIRGPSSHLALFGIRSTLGLTSRDGVIPLVFDRDVAGPMSRTVEDGARLFDVLAGHDPADPLSQPNRREESYLDRLKVDGLRGARLGVVRQHADPEHSDPAVLALFTTALDDLRAAGATIVDPLEIADWPKHQQTNSFCPTFRYDIARYLASLGDNAPIRDVQEAYDRDLYSEHARSSLEFFLGYPADIPPNQWPDPCPTFLDHPARRAFLDDVTAAMNAAKVDALVFPTWSHPPAPLDRGREDYRGDNSQLIAPTTGMPAVTVPMGWVDGTLPAGLQILGRRFADGLLIQFAYAYEQRTHHRRPPQAFGKLTP